MAGHHRIATSKSSSASLGLDGSDEPLADCPRPFPLRIIGWPASRNRVRSCLSAGESLARWYRVRASQELGNSPSASSNLSLRQRKLSAHPAHPTHPTHPTHPAHPTHPT